MSNDFRGWLTEEIIQRGWSKSELARQADLSQSLVSKMLLGDRSITADQCIKIANALGLSPVLVLVKAGILPPQEQKDSNPTLQELMDIARQLPPDVQKDVLAYVRYRFQQEQK